MNEPAFVLSPSLVTKKDVAHLINEFEQLDSDLAASEVRAGIGASVQFMPTLSTRLADFLKQNKIDLKSGRARGETVKRLRAMKESLPVLHMTFAVEADQESLERLVGWVRTSIDPYAVLDIGLQPSLVAGVYLRTPNHVHDLSVRGVLAGRRSILVRELEALRSGR